MKHSPPFERFWKKLALDYIKTKYETHGKIVRQLANVNKASTEKLHEIKAY